MQNTLIQNYQVCSSLVALPNLQASRKTQVPKNAGIEYIALPSLQMT